MLHLYFSIYVNVTQIFLNTSVFLKSSRSDKEFLCKILGESIKAGATTVGIADTVGISMPQEFGELVSYLKANTPGIDYVIFSVHCHNDLGVATANTIAVLFSISPFSFKYKYLSKIRVEQLDYIICRVYVREHDKSK